MKILSVLFTVLLMFSAPVMVEAKCAPSYAVPVSSSDLGYSFLIVPRCGEIIPPDDDFEYDLIDEYDCNEKYKYDGIAILDIYLYLDNTAGIERNFDLHLIVVDRSTVGYNCDPWIYGAHPVTYYYLFHPTSYPILERSTYAVFFNNNILAGYKKHAYPVQFESGLAICPAEITYPYTEINYPSFTPDEVTPAISNGTIPKGFCYASIYDYFNYNPDTWPYQYLASIKIEQIKYIGDVSVGDVYSVDLAYPELCPCCDFYNIIYDFEKGHIITPDGDYFCLEWLFPTKEGYRKSTGGAPGFYDFIFVLTEPGTFNVIGNPDKLVYTAYLYF
jgi:hypothetical protein